MTYIPAELRRQVIERAGGCCEYCRMQIVDRLLPFEIDHIIAEKHGGTTDIDNLCVACYRCTSFKGSDIASADPETGNATYLYHPRQDRWQDHFQLDNAVITPLTPEGRVTTFILRLNMPIHIAQRDALIKEGRYPCEPQR
jgi:5-methylcytosine-specific restriction endonuclease McrA